MVEEWVSTGLTLRANAASWRFPRMGTIEVIPIPDAAVRIQALVSGQTDLALEIAPDDIELLDAQGFAVYQRPATSIAVVVFNLEKADVHPALQDARVRRALNHAIDRETMGQIIWEGRTRTASQHTPVLNPAHDPSLSPYPYDPELARSLLAEAGYPDGFSFTHEFAPSVVGAHIISTYQQIAVDLAKVGVEMTIQPFTWPQLVAGVLQGQWGGDSFGFEYETLPTGETLRPFRMHACSWPTAWYCDEEIEPAIARAKETFNEEERITVLREVLQRYRDQAPNILLFEQLGLDGVGPDVRGYDQVNGLIPYSTIWVDR